MMAYYRVAPGLGMLLAPAIFGLITLAALGVGTLLAALNVAYRDFRYVIPFLVQLWMFATPTVYMQPSAVMPSGLAVPLLALNPMTALIAAFRPRSWAADRLGLARRCRRLVVVGDLRRRLPLLPQGRRQLRGYRSERRPPRHHDARGADDMTAAIRVENLGKRYRVGDMGDAARLPHAPREPGRLATASAAPAARDGGATGRSRGVLGTEGRRFRGPDRARSSGIIGRNGAGKSTLLKILSRITEADDRRGRAARPRRQPAGGRAPASIPS